MSTLADISAALRDLADMIDRLEPAPAPPPPLGPALRRLFPYAEAAAYLGISKRTLARLGTEGEIRKTVIGHRVLFAQEDLDEYVDRLERA
ncbi:helix-turn-helix domain-containing protein [Nocardioides ochotonae]|uniref:helix-turn-helix domain-containing protein n=1 Tax=Nocardioides ochotonae TaxID=2685869 RepID=UPI001407C829|nr:helix-turn-helix domain-containing protein [Nocardioides ochotonae]